MWFYTHLRTTSKRVLGDNNTRAVVILSPWAACDCGAMKAWGTKIFM